LAARFIGPPLAARRLSAPFWRYLFSRMPAPKRKGLLDLNGDECLITVQWLAAENTHRRGNPRWWGMDLNSKDKY